MAQRRRKKPRSQTGGSAAAERRPSSSALGGADGELRVARSGLPPWLAKTLVVLAAVYLGGVFLSAVAPQVPNAVLPRLPRYFTQIACLFPNAATYAIDYRLEVWDCGRREFSELSVRPLFPMHADDKESRFQRTAHFYRQHRTVMRALERYVIEQEEQRNSARSLGGIRLLSLRIPLPAPGDSVARWKREPLATYPDEQRRHWYFTPTSRRRAFCAGDDPDDSWVPRRSKREPSRPVVDPAPALRATPRLNEKELDRETEIEPAGQDT